MIPTQVNHNLNISIPTPPHTFPSLRRRIHFHPYAAAYKSHINWQSTLLYLLANVVSNVSSVHAILVDMDTNEGARHPSTLLGYLRVVVVKRDTIIDIDRS